MKKIRSCGVVRKFLSCLLAIAAGAALADQYVWIPGELWGLYSEVSNWGIGNSEKNYTAATRIPGASDTLAIGTQSGGEELQFHLDLGGGSYSVSQWNASSARPGTARPFAVSNGTLTVTSVFSTHNDPVDVWKGGALKLASTCSYNSGIWDVMPGHVLTVHDGGAFEACGPLTLYQIKVVVETGGKVTFAPTSFTFHDQTAEKMTMSNSGTLSFPNGFSYTSGGTRATGNLTITQEAGTLELGGTFSRNGLRPPLTFVVAGGTIKAVADTSFDPTVGFSVASGVALVVEKGLSSSIRRRADA